MNAMKQLRIQTVISALVMIACWAAPASPGDPTSTAAGVYERLLGSLDLDRPDMADVKQFVTAGDRAAAMRNWIALLAARAQTRPRQQDRYGYWLHGPAAADDLLVGRLTTSRYGDPAVHYEVRIGPPGSIDFFARAPDYPLTIRDISTMHWVNKYAQAYGATRDQKYLRGWCDTWADFADHWPGQLAAIQKDPDIWGKGPDGHQKVLGIGWVGGTLYTAWRMGTIQAGVVGILQTAGTAGQLDAIDPESFAKLLVRLGTVEAPQARALLGRAELGAPNQVREMAIQLFRCGQLFPEFKDARAWRTEAISVVLLSNLPDGTDREQSLNYFNNPLKGLADQIHKETPPGQGDESMLAMIESASLARDRFPPSIARPDGFLPATGTDPVWTHFGKTRKLTPPSRAFTSILFPYGGYAVQRDGWEPESRYLFMKTSRPNKGHWRSQDGGLQLSAFGRNLLVSPIGEVYDVRDQEDGWTPYWNSAVSQNAIVVDGRAAAARTGAFSHLDPLRWHTSPRHDFMETEIRGPYVGPDFRQAVRSDARPPRTAEVQPGGKSDGPPVTDVIHRRQVHFLRDVGCWIVTDRVSSEAPHEFTQSWCYGPEFTLDEVVVDGQQRRISTNQPDAPNLSIWQFGIPDLAYRRYHGVHENGVVLGWVGIMADRAKWRYTPAVNVHCNWRSAGDRVLISLLEPHLGTKSRIARVAAARDGGGVGFDATLADGRQIGYRAAASAESLTTQGLEAEASSLLACREQDGRVTGIALDVRRFGSEPAGTTDFEYERAATGGAVQVTPMSRPTGFRWEGEGSEVRPSYTPPDPSGGHE